MESSGCKHGGKQCSLLRQKHQNSNKISMDRLIKVDEKMLVSNIIHVSYVCCVKVQCSENFDGINIE